MAPQTIREKATAEVKAAWRAAALKFKPVASERFKPSDADFYFHGKPTATFIVRGEPRTLTFGEEFNRRTDVEVFVGQLVEMLVAKDEAAVKQA